VSIHYDFNAQICLFIKPARKEASENARCSYLCVCVCEKYPIVPTCEGVVETHFLIIHFLVLLLLRDIAIIAAIVVVAAAVA
jgi:hypothetical protein